MLTIQNEILEMIARGESLHATMARLCRRVEVLSPGVVCSVVSVDRNGLLHPVAGESLPPEVGPIVEGLPIGPMVGSCGSAVYLNMPVAVLDITTDPRWQDIYPKVAAAGIKACWSSPIRGGNGRVLGAFAFYYRENRGPTDDEQQIVGKCVHLSAIALERHERVLEREHRATHDELTGLGNRAGFNARLARMSCAHPESWGLLAIDLDNLKQVNDTYGHHVGDALLQLASGRLAEAVAPDQAFRIGGDEFVVLVQSPGTLADPEATVAQIFESFAREADCGGFRIAPEASMGGALVMAGDDSPEDVREHADHALYVAKATGRGRYVRYWKGLGSPIANKQREARKIEAGLRDERIDAWYQPIVGIDGGQLEGVEAYCRLTDPTGQVMSAADFGLPGSDARVAFEVTRRMLGIVARDLAQWQSTGLMLPFVAVNVGASDLRVPEFCEVVISAFAAQGVALDRLMLDVSGDGGIGPFDGAVQVIGQLRERGVRIALDDFGKGRSALGDIVASPVDAIKLDPSLVRDLSPGSRASAVGRALVGLAADLGIVTIAEGVETPAQCQWLRLLGCTMGQGYHFAPAMRRGDLLALLEHPVYRRERRFAERAA